MNRVDDAFNMSEIYISLTTMYPFSPYPHRGSSEVKCCKEPLELSRRAICK